MLCTPQRLERATGLILLDVSTIRALWRYVRRCWFEKDRLGALDGQKDTVKWGMIHWICVAARKSRKKWEKLFEVTDLPKVRLGTQGEIDAFYRAMKLERRR